jgi:hypothetical protein
MKPVLAECARWNRAHRYNTKPPQNEHAQQDLANVRRRIAHLSADEQAMFLREARAAAKRLVDADWTLLSDLARHLYRRGALDHMDLLNILQLDREGRQAGQRTACVR